MEIILVDGGKRLSGDINVSGSKNAALPLMAATLLSDGPHRLANVPDVTDVKHMANLLEFMGAKVQLTRRHFIDIDQRLFKLPEAPYHFMTRMRACLLVLGPLVARHQYAMVSYPGGCRIGSRPIDMHLYALEKMGAKIKIEKGNIIVRAKYLKGADIYFERPTVTGTENILMAATLAQGKTVLRNCAKEPEVVALGEALQKMGAVIEGLGTETITIEGVDALTALEHTIIPDRIECATLMIATAITRGDVTLIDCNPDHVTSVIYKLREIGVEVLVEENRINVIGPRRLKATNIETQVYPGFPTDVQAQITALLCLADGQSVIQETIFENRFQHVPELRRLGGNVYRHDSHIVVEGIREFQGTQVRCRDIRAGAALVVAALAAEGRSTVYGVQYLDRAYNHLDLKLSRLGAEIQRIEETSPTAN